MTNIKTYLKVSAELASSVIVGVLIYSGFSLLRGITVNWTEALLCGVAGFAFQNNIKLRKEIKRLEDMRRQPFDPRPQ